jgi:Flp pilus assembly protein TadD
MRCHFMSLALILAPVSAAAQDRADEGSLGYEAIMAGDYTTAEAQLRNTKDFAWNDPARLINLGQVMARMGRTKAASEYFRQAISAEECELILADGSVVSSREAALQALRDLRPVRLSSR